MGCSSNQVNSGKGVEEGDDIDSGRLKYNQQSLMKDFLNIYKTYSKLSNTLTLITIP